MPGFVVISRAETGNPDRALLSPGNYWFGRDKDPVAASDERNHN
jgi:hypothetical protein